MRVISAFLLTINEICAIIDVEIISKGNKKMYESEKERLKKQTSFTMDDLNLIMKILRAKDGCPWDIEQTHESIVPSLIEETYEAVEAIEQRNPKMLKEELGDVLLQVAFHARISEEAGEFDFSDVVADVSLWHRCI